MHRASQKVSGVAKFVAYGASQARVSVVPHGAGNCVERRRARA